MKPTRAPWRTPEGSRRLSEWVLISRPAIRPAAVAPNIRAPSTDESAQVCSPNNNTGGSSVRLRGAPAPPADGAGPVGGWLSEDGGPVVLHADDGPSVASRLLEGGLGAAGVRELAVGVVVEDEQAQERIRDGLREVQHRAVAVAVAGREQWSATDPAPDANGLLRPVV